MELFCRETDEEFVLTIIVSLAFLMIELSIFLLFSLIPFNIFFSTGNELM